MEFLKDNVLGSLIVGMLVIAATYFVTRHWKGKEKVAKTEDKQVSASEKQTSQLASEVETLRKQKEMDVEADRKERASRLEEQQTQLVDRVDDNEREQSERMSALKVQIAELSTRIEPLNQVFQSILIKQLTHYHTPIMDALMEKLGDVGVAPTITEEEKRELIVALKQRTLDMGPEIDDDERDAAEMLPALMRRVKREQAAVAAGEAFVAIQSVGILHQGENGETIRNGKEKVEIKNYQSNG